jgi:hypothetical protein
VMPDASCSVPQTKSLAGVAAKIRPFPRTRSPGARIREMAWYDDYLAQGGADRSANPSPGNKKGGLNNIVEKSLAGVAAKIRPFPRTRSPGASTPRIALVPDFATTGRGTPYGLAEAPVIKVATRTELAERWSDLIDLDAGPGWRRRSGPSRVPARRARARRGSRWCRTSPPSRAESEAVARDLIREMAWYDDYLAQGGADRSANPSPGNKKGGGEDQALPAYPLAGREHAADRAGAGLRHRAERLLDDVVEPPAPARSAACSRPASGYAGRA